MAKKNIDPGPAQRLAQVVKASGLRFYTFATRIGVNGQTLYQIRRGNNRISLTVAERIHNSYPKYSIPWLMFGMREESTMLSENSQIVRIPVYRDFDLLLRYQKEESDEFISLSATVSNDAEVAVPYADDILNPYLRNSMLLLRQCRDAIIFGNIYLVITDQENLFRIGHKDSNNPDNLCLATPHPLAFDNIVIPKSQILSMWLVCGAICKMER